MDFFKKLFNKIRTKLGFVSSILLILASKESVLINLFFTGLFLILIGELIRIWSAGHLRKTKIVVCSGPYKFTRNPLYIGSFFILTGFLIIIQSWIAAIIILPLFLIVYPLTIKKEEKHLLNKFGDEFQEYMNNVPRFFPRFKAGDCSSDEKFDFQLMIKNREYQSVLASIALSIIFWFGFGYQLRVLIIDLFNKLF